MLYQGRTFKAYRGMGCLGAMVQGSSERYRQAGSEGGTGKLVPEGVEGRVPFKGPLTDFVYQLVGGLRAGMGYCGAKTIDELRTEARFIQVSAASVRESHPHDIAITQEAPNYSPEYHDGKGRGVAGSGAQRVPGVQGSGARILPSLGHGDWRSAGAELHWPREPQGFLARCLCAADRGKRRVVVSCWRADAGCWPAL